MNLQLLGKPRVFVERKDFLVSAVLAHLALLIFPTSAPAATSYADYSSDTRDPALLRSLVNVLRAQGGVLFLLDRIRSKQARLSALHSNLC